MPVYDSKKLFDYLKELEIVDTDKLLEAIKESEKQKKPLGEMLLSKDLVSDETLGKVIADVISYPFVKLSEKYVETSVLNFVPETFARSQRIIVFENKDDEMYVAMGNPENIEVKEFLRKKSGKEITVFFATDRDIAHALALYNKDMNTAFADLMQEHVKEAQSVGKSEPPVVKIVDKILEYAYQNNASDVHIEAEEKGSLVRFRVDGILQDIVTLPPGLHERIVSRIKVMSGIRTDEHQKAQDGKIVAKIDEENLDIRVSIVPVTEGEKVVLRLLSEHARSFSLIDLGLSEPDVEKTKSAYQKPHGMILATGPTGSGKTTTLYAILKTLNREGVNIMTIEDPVEYDIERVNQIQVNEKSGLSFAKGLRSIVRQDPDIILVGEIRDEETAAIAVNSAMTGHLVLSTIHTNDAATTIPRLYDLGVEPYLVASTVNLIIAQRLVRKICAPCRVSVEIDVASLKDQVSEDLLKHYFISPKVRLYKGKGCEVCNMTGYYGRVGVFEVIVVDDEIRSAITNKSTASEINKIARKNGMTSMLEDGIRKAQGGVTTIEEVLRVTRE